jgi:hypothetical protein
MLECGGMKDDLRPVLAEDAGERCGVADADKQRYEGNGILQFTDRLMDIVKGALRCVEEKQFTNVGLGYRSGQR